MDRFVSRLIRVVWLLWAAGCQTAAPPAPAPVAPAPPTPAPAPTRAAPDAGAARTLPTILRRRPKPPPLPEHVARCLAQGVRAVIELRQSRPDCSGVGHVQMVFDVREARGASTPLRTAYGSQPLHSAFVSPRRPGSLFVAALHLDRRPARRIFCVQIPAIDATVSCAHPVADLEEGRRILDAVGAR
jgi:hypothetical protein